MRVSKVQAKRRDDGLGSGQASRGSFRVSIRASLIITHKFKLRYACCSVYTRDIRPAVI